MHLRIGKIKLISPSNQDTATLETDTNTIVVTGLCKLPAYLSYTYTDQHKPYHLRYASYAIVKDYIPISLTE